MKKFLYLVMTDQIEGGMVLVVRGLLWILSQMFRFLVTLRGGLYQTGVLKNCRLPVPVISVGNITVGGTGKTPIVGFIARALKEKGIRPAILMRGYMAQTGPVPEQGSDEAAMLREALNIPVLVGADRSKSARAFLKKGNADVFLLDDGFQHWRLSRDMDIVVIDVTNPWGNGHLLPRGILRESKTALRRAQVFILTKVDFGKEFVEQIRRELSAVNPEALIVESLHNPVLFSDLRSGEEIDLTSVRARKICTVCGIAAPNAFIKTLIELEADIDGHFAFMDHHVYTATDIESIVRTCQECGITTVVTTEKDAVKLKPFLRVFPDYIRVLSLKIEISIVNGEGDFLERIHHLL